MSGGADRHAVARPGDAAGAEGAAGEDRREGRHRGPEEEGRRQDGRTIKERTEGGVLHGATRTAPTWTGSARRSSKAYGGRAPRVLDPFAGGGAIPLEAMRLGCEVTAIDINPVAWFILKCTLEYPQKLAGQTRPLPKFAVESPRVHGGVSQGDGQAHQEAGG